MRSIALLVVALLVLSSTAYATPITLSCGGGGVDAGCGQSFTVPAVDNILQSFSFTGVGAAKSFTFELFAFSSGFPLGALVGAPLYSETLAATAGGGSILETRTFTPPGGLALTSGAQYAALILVPGGEGVLFSADNANPYAGGQPLLCVSGQCFLDQSDDVSFVATFVAAPSAPVPEPATLTLVGVGALVLGRKAARRRTAASASV